MMLTRRHVTLAGLAAAALPAAGAAPYPSKPVSIVVGFAAGGGADAVIRTVAEPLSARLGQPVIVDNRPGASGSIAARYVANANPDGHVLFGTDGGAMALNGALYSKLGYDPVRSFAPVSLIIRAPLLLVANPAFPVSDLKGLTSYSRQSGAQLSYASPGPGTYHHLGMELLKSRTGIVAQGAQYRGAGAAVQDVLGGQVQVMPLDSIVALPLLRAGKLKAIVTLTSKRIPQLPDVPTAAEAGFPDIDVYPWVGLVAPSATPPAVVERLSKETREVVASVDVANRFTNLGMEPYATTPEEFSAFIRKEIERWHPLIKKLEIQLD